MDHSNLYESNHFISAGATVDVLIRENSALHLDNEKLNKLLKQKKTESELWKSKYENQMG